MFGRTWTGSVFTLAPSPPRNNPDRRPGHRAPPIGVLFFAVVAKLADASGLEPGGGSLQRCPRAGANPVDRILFFSAKLACAADETFIQMAGILRVERSL